MNVLYITDEILITSRAPALHVIEICDSLRKKGIHVTLFAPSLSTYKTDNFKIKYIYMNRFLKSVFYHPLLLLNIILYRLKNRDKPIVYIRYFPLLFTSILLCRLLSIKCILEVNGKSKEETEILKSRFPMNILPYIYESLDNISFKNSTKIIAVANGIKKSIVENFKIDPSKVVVIQNGVNTNKFKSLNTIKVRKQLSLDNNYLYVGYIGSFYSYQGLDYIIKSAQKVSKKHPNARYIIVGNGSEFEKKRLLDLIKELKLENVINIIGPIDNSQVPLYINSFDICLCYPTQFRSEATSPFKLFEYLACAKPVISSDIKGIGEFFKDSIVLAKADNSSKLAEKIMLLLDSKKLRSNLGRKGREFILTGHSWDNVADRIVKVIKE